MPVRQTALPAPELSGTPAGPPLGERAGVVADAAGFDSYVPFEEVSVVTRALSPD